MAYKIAGGNLHSLTTGTRKSKWLSCSLGESPESQTSLLFVISSVGLPPRLQWLERCQMQLKWRPGCTAETNKAKVSRP